MCSTGRENSQRYIPLVQEEKAVYFCVCARLQTNLMLEVVAQQDDNLPLVCTVQGNRKQIDFAQGRLECHWHHTFTLSLWSHSDKIWQNINALQWCL